jgi:hypothetical protein
MPTSIESGRRGPIATPSVSVLYTMVSGYLLHDMKMLLPRAVKFML